MDAFNIEMYLKYPFVSKKTQSDGRCFHEGFIEVMDNCDLIISTKNLPEEPVDMLEYLDKAAKNLDVKMKSKTKPKNNVEKYRKVLTEYSELLQFHLNILKATLNPDLTGIELMTKDERNRHHALKIRIDFANDCLFHIEEHTLPDLIFNKDNNTCDNSLMALYDKFLSELENPLLVNFLDFMSELDRSCWVLDPIDPTFKDMYRRISIGDNISMVLTYNSFDVKVLPNIRFLGPRNLVSEFEERLNKNFLNWDGNTEDPMHELAILLELLEFPLKPYQDNKKIEGFLLVNMGECCICFQSQLEDKLPEVVCSNQSCNQVFHVKCLFQWLSALSNMQNVFYEISGKCPNCEKLIHCPVPQ